MPSNTRNRALYTGSMYRIGLEMILVVAIATSVVFGAALLDYGPQRGAFSDQANKVAAAFLLAVFLLALWANAAYGTAKTCERLKKFFGSFLAWSIVIYFGGVALIALPALLARYDKLPGLQHHVVAVLGLAVSVAYWNWRYVSGSSLRNGASSSREPLDSPFAGFIFFVPTAMVLCLYSPGNKSVLPSAGYLIG